MKVISKHQIIPYVKVCQELHVPNSTALIARSAHRQTDQDWMQPGNQADREEMVRILVQDLKASVKVLDMHDYRWAQTK